MMMMMKAYIAAPWFTPEQLDKVERLKDTLNFCGIEFFSPKDENLFGENNTASVFEVLDGNINAIIDCNFIIAITDGKDVGTMWEAGYAYAKGVPILYLWLDRQEGQKFNLMLAASGGVAYNMNDVWDNIAHFEQHNFFIIPDFDGKIE